MRHNRLVLRYPTISIKTKQYVLLQFRLLLAVCGRRLCSHCFYQLKVLVLLYSFQRWQRYKPSICMKLEIPSILIYKFVVRINTTNMVTNKIGTLKQKRKYLEFTRTLTLQKRLRCQCRKIYTTKQYRPVRYTERACTATGRTLHSGNAVINATVLLELIKKVHVLLALLISAKTREAVIPIFCQIYLYVLFFQSK